MLRGFRLACVMTIPKHKTMRQDCQGRERQVWLLCTETRLCGCKKARGIASDWPNARELIKRADWLSTATTKGMDEDMMTRILLGGMGEGRAKRQSLGQRMRESWEGKKRFARLLP